MLLDLLIWIKAHFNICYRLIFEIFLYLFLEETVGLYTEHEFFERFRISRDHVDEIQTEFARSDHFRY
jgi:hypothetical protein